MTERKEPYVGVSGVVSVEQREILQSVARRLDLAEHRHLAIGIKAVHKTQWLDIPNKYGPAWYPIGEEGMRRAVLSGEDRSYTIAQMYLDPEVIATSPEYPHEFVSQVLKRGRGLLHAVQFDLLPYHDRPARWTSLFEMIKSEGQDVILQCHRPAMTEGPQEAVRKLEDLSENIDYVLFDASHGTGAEMDTERLLEFCSEAYGSSRLADAGVNFGVAGGLDANTVQSELWRVVDKFPQISWDAEGKLHNGTTDGGLNIPATTRYLTASARLLQSRK